MKLLTYSLPGQAPSAGVLLADGVSVADVGAVMEQWRGRPGTGDVVSVKSLLQTSGVIANLRAALQATTGELLAKVVVGRIDDIDLRAPIPDPGKILAAGMNYAAHVVETRITPPVGMPGFFSKLPSSVIGPRDGIMNPEHLGSQLDYETELAIVIGAEGIEVPSTGVIVAGWMVGNDVSLRDLQVERNQLTLGKGIDTFCPLGPVLVVPEPGDDLPRDLTIECFVNGELRQSSTTADMIFGIESIIQILADHIRLDPGDIILTGSPHGVGMGRTPQTWLTEGDLVVCRIEGIGELENRIVAWSRKGTPVASH